MALELLEAPNLRSELEGHTVKELRELGKKWSVDLAGKRLKAEVVDAIASALEATDTSPGSGQAGEEPDGPDMDLSFDKLEVLWVGAQNRLAEGDYRSAIALSQESLQLLDGWELEYRRGVCSRALEAAELFTRRFEDRGPARTLKKKVKEARKAFEGGDLDRCSDLLKRLEPDMTSLYTAELGRVQEVLVEKERTLEGLSALDIDLSKAHELLSKAEEASGEADYAKALDLIHSFEAEVAAALRARELRMREHLNTVADRLKETEGLNIPVEEGRKLLAQAKAALDGGDLAMAGELTQRCEMSVIEVQKMHMDRAMRLRKKHYQEVRDLLSYLKPILQEARNYGIDIDGAKVLISESLNHLRQDEYFQAMKKGREARRLTKSMQSIIAAERKTRGIVEPHGGQCSQCDSQDLQYQDDGWAECNKCHSRFPWATKQEPWLISFFRRKLAK